jgi:hypothetical protein
VNSHSLITLTLLRMYLSPKHNNPRNQAESVQKGVDLDSVFGPDATIIDLSTIHSVKFDMIANTLTLDFVSADKPGRVQLSFNSHETADDVYTKLWRRLGDQVELRKFRSDYWELARMPVALMAVVIIGVALISAISNAASDLSSKPIWLDWRWICGFGGIILAMLQLLLYRRITQPPQTLELIRKS